MGKQATTPTSEYSMYTKGLSSLATVYPHLPQGSHSRGIKKLGQAIKVVIAKVHCMFWVNSHRYNPSLGEMQPLWVFWPRFGVTVDKHPPPS